MSGGAESSAFAAFAAQSRPKIEAALEDMLPAAAEPPTELHAAMRHAMFPGGKRLRPLLALMGCQITGGDVKRALRPAAALECLHTYSLVHDDLPCMDDDDLRRGRPTCHRVFGEAIAVLAGDGLLTLALEVAAEAGPQAVSVLARAAGSRGMVGGQAGDLAAEGSAAASVGLEQVEWIHDRKTGALISASLEVGALAGGGDLGRLGSLREYGTLLGRAFQIADDCLDLTGTADQLGKQPGQDLAADKLTYPAVLGLEASSAAADELSRRAAGLAPGCVGPVGRTGLDADIGLLQDTAFVLAARNT